MQTSEQPTVSQSDSHVIVVQNPPLVYHCLQCWDDTVFADLEEISVATNSLEILHDNSVIRIGGNSALNQCVEQFSVFCERKVRKVRFLAFFLGDGIYPLDEGGSSFWASCTIGRDVSQ